MTKIAINGMGRIGRLILAAYFEGEIDDLEIVAVNDLSDINTTAHLLKFDSVHGIAPFDVSIKGDTLIVDGKKIKYCSERDPEKLPWKKLGVDIVAECTGVFTDKKGAQKHIKAGAKKVLISAPAKDDDLTIVFGVNDDKITSKMKIFSNGSCTTNALAPVLKVLDDKFGVVDGYMTTVHSYTGDQRLVDTYHKDLRRARAAALSIIPTSTGAANAIGKVLPKLEGKLKGSALRVPTADVSMADLVVTLKKKVKKEDINKAMLLAATDELEGILEYVELPLVSVDFIHNPSSSIFDATLTEVVGDKMVRLVAWYDNEWGFSCRMLDTMSVIGEKM
ncbi:MAG: type I glyceraldehyde-3-phosphate dehydrogenase [Rickettsiales bacterium]|jgi:glyceraldehyde 3-phosphate dehydrogenase|nr:type I glyceraldehyde-3-phosphate dehydrogenase [Rickettsiales bacterium]